MVSLKNPDNLENREYLLLNPALVESKVMSINLGFSGPFRNPESTDHFSNPEFTNHFRNPESAELFNNPEFTDHLKNQEFTDNSRNIEFRHKFHVFDGNFRICFDFFPHELELSDSE